MDSASGACRLDLDEACRPSLYADGQAGASAGASELVFERLDGPSVGPISSHHTLGLFSRDGKRRVDIGGGTTKPQTVLHEGAGSTLRLWPTYGTYRFVCPLAQGEATPRRIVVRSDDGADGTATSPSPLASTAAKGAPIMYGQSLRVLSAPSEAGQISQLRLGSSDDLSGGGDMGDPAAWSTRLQVNQVQPMQAPS